MKRYFIFLVLLISALHGVAQKDSSTVVTNNNIYNQRHLSVKGNYFIGLGLGENFINPYQYGEYKSVAYNGVLEYGFDENLLLGVGVAYSKSTITNDGGIAFAYNDNISAVNLSARALCAIASTRTIQFYCGFMAGARFIKDETIPAYPPYPGTTNTTRGSIEVLTGIRIFLGPVGLHFEGGFGADTPYNLEAGLTFRL